MKSFITALVTLVFAPAAFAAPSQKIVNQCQNLAIRAAYGSAKSTGYKLEVVYSRFEGVSRTNPNAFMYSVSLDSCDDHGCGGMGYTVVTVTDGQSCKVVRVQLVSEE